jgi:hypothetical protein
MITEHKKNHMTLEIQIRQLGQAQICGDVKPVNGIPTLPSLYFFVLILTSNKQYFRSHVVLCQVLES